MALPFEKIVKEDLQLGYGTVSVTMPNGGSATGTKLGLHTSAGTINAKEYGCVGDGVANDAASLQSCCDVAAAANLGVYLPPGTYNLYGTTIVLNTFQHLWGAGRQFSLIKYTGLGSAFSYTKPINSSGFAELRIHDVQIRGYGGSTNIGAALEINAGGWAYFQFENLYILGDFQYGMILDSVELCKIQFCNIGNGAGSTTTASPSTVNVWIVNGDTRRTSQGQNYSNFIQLKDCNLSSADLGIQDDGGFNHTFENLNFEGQGMAMQMRGVNTFAIRGVESENNTSRETDSANVLFTDSATFSPCQAGVIEHCLFNMNMSTPGQLLAFRSTTGQYHRGIVVHGNLFSYRFGQTGDIDVAALGGGSWVYGNQHAAPVVAAVPHFNNLHEDSEAPSLFWPYHGQDAPTTTVPGLSCPMLIGKKTWDPGSIADGAFESTTVTVTGATPGDMAVVGFNQIAGNWVLTAFVEDTSTVRVVLMNKTGGSLNPTSGTLRVTVIKHVTA